VTNGQLQSSLTILNSGTWSNIETQPFSNASRLNVTNPIIGGSAYYRLVTN